MGNRHLPARRVLGATEHDIRRHHPHRLLPLPHGATRDASYENGGPHAARVVYREATVVPLGDAHWALALGTANEDDRGYADLLALRIRSGDPQDLPEHLMHRVRACKGAASTMVFTSQGGLFGVGDERFRNPLVTELGPRRPDDLLARYAAGQRPRTYVPEAAGRLAEAVEHILAKF